MALGRFLIHNSVSAGIRAKSKQVDLQLGLNDFAFDAKIAEDVTWSIRLRAASMSTKGLRASLSILSFCLNTQGKAFLW